MGTHQFCSARGFSTRQRLSFDEENNGLYHTYQYRSNTMKRTGISTISRLFILVWLCNNNCQLCSAFWTSTLSTQSTTVLRDISEWRDHDFGLPGGSTELGVATGRLGPPKAVPILPFPFEEVSKQTFERTDRPEPTAW